MRETAARNAALQVLSAPSLSSQGAALRKSHINIGFERPGEVELRRQTETKQSYVAQPLPIRQSAEETRSKVAALQKSNIDLAFGVEKTGKAWKADQTEHLAANVEAKYNCEQVAPIDGARNYKSVVHFGDHAPGEEDVRVSETKCQYADPGKPERAVSYASTLGKELRQHSWDNAMGRVKSTASWQTAQNAEMSRKATEKFQVVKPTVDPRLSKALRQSSVYLGKDGADWPEQGGLQRSFSMPGGLNPIGKGARIECRY